MPLSREYDRIVANKYPIHLMSLRAQRGNLITNSTKHEIAAVRFALLAMTCEIK